METLAAARARKLSELVLYRIGDALYLGCPGALLCYSTDHWTIPYADKVHSPGLDQVTCVCKSLFECSDRIL